MSPVGYIAYIDEAGDTGLKNIRASEKPGASEWLVMSAVLVRAEREAEVDNWTRQLIASLGSVELHRELITAAARVIIALKLWSVLSALMAIRLNSFSLPKKFSIRWCHL